ncbi:GNAT family N-acetyltransferase [Thermoflavimicrobium daqui]|jgi:ribosomal-protein-alanine N-acetyltransferase|uniref:RimJ/RimL family protein N-acetyltransferase n=1 Tax=Thermoflavimicrobium daqui TaxID=2137476 RepID=A0A364K3X5_9BACL|nr:GNAT family N-acetyltransferase [Thermoflavimicrobium daqui]RAL24037.1 RimJ/RimL family protein N-acetyltransferase [Thermoflavimicrobium daqui]
MGDIYIRKLQIEDALPLLELRLRNRQFLKAYEPITPDSHYTLEEQQKVIHSVARNWDQDLGYGFGVFLQPTHQLIGRVNLSNVVRGAWQNCTIGYFLDQQMNGKGYMTKAVQQAIHFAFYEVNLHRVQAAIMPHNVASLRVIEKVGFRKEGYSKYYLKINGKWEDHLIYAITPEMSN